MSLGNGLALKNIKSTESFFLQIYADSRETALLWLSGNQKCRGLTLNNLLQGPIYVGWPGQGSSFSLFICTLDIK